MNELQFIQHIRRKTTRTAIEILLLRYHRMKSEISDIIVDQSKCNLDMDTALHDIRSILSNNIAD